MKNVLIAAIALVLGVVLGGLPPRAEVRRLQAQIEELEKRRSGFATELAEMLTRHPPAEAPITPIPPELIPDDDPVADVQHDPEPGLDEEAPPEFLGEPVEQSPEESLALAREALEIRRSQAWEALRQDADPTEEQLADIDAAVHEMNEELRVVARELVERIGAEEVPSRRDMMYFGADMLDVLINADERISGILSQEQYDAAQEEAVDPLSYLDPSLLDVFAELDL